VPALVTVSMAPPTDHGDRVVLPTWSYLHPTPGHAAEPGPNGT
jgi:hypothetical protein